MPLAGEIAFFHGLHPALIGSAGAIANPKMAFQIKQFRRKRDLDDHVIWAMPPGSVCGFKLSRRLISPFKCGQEHERA